MGIGSRSYEGEDQGYPPAILLPPQELHCMCITTIILELHVLIAIQNVPESKNPVRASMYMYITLGGMPLHSPLVRVC